MLKNKIAIYCRVSSDEQAERGTIENQRIFAEKYIDLHQLTVHDYYMDDGVTGTLPIQERPAGKRLLDDARDGKFNLVLFYKLDRLGRATRVILNAVAELKKYGVDIRSMTEPFDTSTPSGQFTLTMFAGIAELDRENILARMRQGAINSATKGKWMGGAPPYGYKLVDGYLAYDDEPIESLPYSPKDVALMIFELCVKDKISTYQIADKLNAMGIPPRYRLLRRKGTYTGKWFPTKVADILHNKVYFGEHVFGGMSKRKDKVEIMQTCPAIVTKDIWEQAQKCLEQNYYRPTSKKQRTYLLRGLIKCAHCGATYCGTTPSSRGQNTSYYACYNKTRYYPADTAFQRCSSRNIRADWLEALVWQDCMRYIMQPDTILEEINADDSLNKIKAEIEALKTNLSKLEQERKTAVNLCIKGIINEDDLAEQLKEIDNGIANIKTAMADNDALLDNADASPTVDKLNKIKNRLAENELDEREKQIIIQELVKEIIITSPPDDSNDIKLGVEIKYRFGATKNDSEFNPLSHQCGFNLESISTVAEKLRYYRCQAGLTITQLAERSGITVVSLSKYENGHKAPQIQLLRAICTALNIQSHLITDADKMPEDTLQERYEKARMLQCYTRREINSEIGLSHKSVNAVLVGRRITLPETIAKIENFCNKILNEYRQ